MLRRGLLALRGTAGARRALARQQRRHATAAACAAGGQDGALPGAPARLLLKNAAQIVTVGGGAVPKTGAAMGEVEVLRDHSLLVGADGRVVQLVPAGAPTDALLQQLCEAAAGRAAAAGGGADCAGVDAVVDCAGKVILPGFVDGHTHAVFAGDRSHEHAMKLAGATYEEVHEAGGGINFTVRAVREAAEPELLAVLLARLDGMMRAGTTTCEVKTGYGLDFATELKMLRVIQAARARHRMDISCTFLVHAVPAGRTAEEVTVDVVDNQLPELRRMIDAGSLRDPVDFIDVFCEHGPSFFTPDQSRRILEAGRALLGAEAAFHGDELSDQGCGVLAAEVGARSVSHLEMLNPDGVAAMARAGVHAVLLPTTAYLLRLQSPPARALVEAGAPVALASDFNPNAFCADMPAVMNLACVTFGLTMPEALVAATLNAASALGQADVCGTLEVGKKGDCVVLDAPSWEHVVYNMRPSLSAVFKEGVSVTRTAGAARRAPMHADAETTAALAGLAHGLQLNGDTPLPPPVTYDGRDDGGLPHAPKRPVRLTPELRRKAIANALRYFPPQHHAELARDFAEELRRFGHIYMHRFLPRDPDTGRYNVRARPVGSYPARSTQAAALMHMIQNNLDPAVAQFPAELVTYGGNGTAFSNWAQYHETMRLLANMTDEQTLVLYSGHPMGLFPSHPDAPRLVVTNGLTVPNYSSRDDYERMYALGVSQYGQMTAGSFCYIGPQGIVHGTVLTLLNAGRKYLQAPDLRGKVFVTAGLGGMSGAQAKAAVICGAVGLVAEVSPEAAEKRHRQGWVENLSDDLDQCLEWAAAAASEGRSTSIAYVGNVVDLWERLASDAAARRPGAVVPHLGSDQTSCHIPFSGGYFPVGHSYDESKLLMAADPAAFKQAVQASLRRHVAAVNALVDDVGLRFWDYGNSFLLEASRADADVLAPAHDGSVAGAGADDAGRPVFRYPSYVQDIMGDIFSLGFGPFRWVCTSGLPADLATTDAIARDVLLELRGELLQRSGGPNVEGAVDGDGDGGGDGYAARAVPQLDDNILWIEEAEAHRLVVGSQARILYANAAARARIAAAFNAAVGDGRLTSPVMLSRDHHDVSGTDAPWRETSNVEDGSKFCADMAVQNVIGDACRGATSVSLHNGGGTGWGEAMNGGFLMCLDGSADAARRAERMLHWDVFNGVARRAWAGNANALSYTKDEQAGNPAFSVHFPHAVDPTVLEVALSDAPNQGAAGW